MIYLHLDPFMPVVPIHCLSNNICSRSMKPLDLAVVDHILIAEVLLVTPPSAPPTCSAGGGFVCAAVPPLDNGGPGLFDNGSHVRANLLYCGFVGHIPINGDKGFWLVSSFPNKGEGWERERGGRQEGGGALVSLAEGRGPSGWAHFHLADTVWTVQLILLLHKTVCQLQTQELKLYRGGECSGEL